METAPARSRGTVIAFRVVAALGFVFFGILTVLFAFPSYVDDAEKIHAFHNAAALSGYVALSGVPMALLAWRPRQVALLRLIVAVGIGSVIGAALSGVPFTYLLGVPVFTVGRSSGSARRTCRCWRWRWSAPCPR
jgi:hypothetical protein